MVEKKTAGENVEELILEVVIWLVSSAFLMLALMWTHTIYEWIPNLGYLDVMGLIWLVGALVGIPTRAIAKAWKSA